MGVEICFDSYLRSVIADCQKSMRLYTLMDDCEQSQPDFFELKMQVAEPQPKYKAQSEQDADKDRNAEPPIPVIEIYKYAQDHVLLMGKAGSGKSTALQKLLSVKVKASLDEQSTLIPVLIELRSWRTSVIDLIKNFFRKHRLRLDIQTIDDLLFDGRLLLLVDGVNELPSDEARNNLEQFRDMNSDTPMIFTTRVLGVSRNLGIAKQMEMLPLSDREMHQFIEKCLPQQSEQLLKQLGDRLSKFGETPLLLSMLCDVFQKDGKIPANLGATFRDFANLYDGKIKENIPVDEKYRSWTSELLQQIAFAMMPQNNPHGLRLEIPKFEAENILANFLDDEKFDKPRDYAKQWLENLLKYHLIQIKTDQTIEFRHQLIQEYYAAEYLYRLLEKLSNEKLQKSYLNYLDWTESLALMLELVEEDQAVLLVRLALKVDLRLGARLAGAVRYGFQEKTFGLLIREIEERKISRLISIRLVGETKSDTAVEYLSRELEQDNDEINIEIIESLQRIRSVKASEILVKSLQHQNYETCLNILFVLSEIGDKIFIKLLINEVKNQKPSLRWKAVQLIGSVAYSPIENLIEPLLDALSDKGFEDRDIAATSLENLVVDKSAEFLIQVLKDKGERHNVRLSAALALERLGERGNKKAIELLVESLKEIDPIVSSKAKCTLIHIGNQNVVEAINGFINREDLQMKNIALSILKCIEKDQEELNARIEGFDNKYIQKGESLSFDENCDPELLIQNLINSLDNEDEYESTMARKKLMMMSDVPQYLLILIEKLPTLFKFIGTSEHIYSIITPIQARCKYYNYTIYDTTLQKESKSESIRTPVTINVHGDNATVIGNVEGNVNNHSKSTKPP